jgi:2-polyprenyl-3-methyl-5-hydroxy-6-metoxy-1,4-benzoquinol methylase
MLDRPETPPGVKTPCPLCGAGDPVCLFAKATQEYWRCTRCALVFAIAQTNANFRTSIQGFEPAYRQYLEETPVDRPNLEDVVSWLERHVPLTREVRLLDVGAGTGKLFKHLKRSRPCQVFGIEPSSALFDAYGLSALGIEPITLPQLAARSGPQFDVVTVLDVIEHVPAASEFISALAQITKPGGFVFVTTPDTDGPLARLLGRWWHHYNPYHFSLYGRTTLEAAARLGRFQMVAAEHRSKMMSLDYLWRYAVDFLFAGQRRGGSYKPSRFAIPINLRDAIAVVWRR